MIEFVNAKINIGLNVTGRRPDGYHLLETCFYPVGKHNGTPRNPEPFCDVMELTMTSPGNPAIAGINEIEGIGYFFSGNTIDCPPEKNLVVRAGSLFAREYRQLEGCPLSQDGKIPVIRLEKHIPDGAGLGGGSADATFTLRLLNDRFGRPFSDIRLERMAVGLGADCPVFVRNIPVFAEGIGEIFSPVTSHAVTELGNGTYWLALVKPDLHISTREAFAGLTPAPPAIPLREALKQPVEAWRGTVTNDFETSLFPLYPELGRLKEALYAHGALYASMTGSGAALYGIFTSCRKASGALECISAPYSTIILL
ncbi:MAG: 4-(cytidine 5'-diphospho)-2-C-methyl-D-erythritol kinase [Muribaculaceae bacterium]|nr:4-(cytidine 5'-diphospho)-2-C-methyl-D-erythritol kinase [Muribaculaceae bacterium]